MDKSLVAFMKEMEGVCADLAALTPDTILSEIPTWDDLNHMRLIDRVRERYEVDMDIEELGICKTPADIFRLLRKTLAKTQSEQVDE